MTIRPTRYALFDFDGTLSKGFISMKFMDYLHDRGLYSDEAYGHQQDILKQYQSHQMPYAAWVDEWGRSWAQGLAGSHRSEVQAAARDFFQQFKPNLYPEARELVRLCHEHGLQVMLLSAGAGEPLEPVQEALGFDGVIATRAQVVEDVYTGQLETRVHTPEGKAEAVDALAQRWGQPEFAFGDSAGDVGMLERARVPVALNPTPELEAVAQQRGWAHMPIAQAPDFLAHQGWLLATA